MIRNIANILVTDRADFGFAICDLSSFFSLYKFIFLFYLFCLYQNIKHFIFLIISVLLFLCLRFYYYYVISFLKNNKLFLYHLVKLYILLITTWIWLYKVTFWPQKLTNLLLYIIVLIFIVLLCLDSYAY